MDIIHFFAPLNGTTPKECNAQLFSLSVNDNYFPDRRKFHTYNHQHEKCHLFPIDLLILALAFIFLEQVFSPANDNASVNVDADADVDSRPDLRCRHLLWPGVERS